MSNFHVGQKVVCINDHGSPEVWNGFRIARQGSIYTVRSIYYFGETELLLLEEIVNQVSSYSCGFKDCEPGFESESFRPLVERKPDISVFTDMLNYQPKVVVSS